MTLKNSTSSLLFILMAISTSAYAWQFGTDGRNGSDGYPGRDGRSGQDVRMVADGQVQNLLLIGEDGGDGGRGEDGDNAYGCFQRASSSDELGAAGGAGGDSGTAGDGGRGGDLFIQTPDVAHLSKILVNSQGGRGGRGGSVGRGGHGCYCVQRSWVIKKNCRREKDRQGHEREVCDYTRYYCYDGRDGREGTQLSRYGSEGRKGRLTLVKQLAPVPEEHDSTHIKLSQIVNGPIELTANIWLTKMGASGLLAPGSIVSDSYREYSHLQSYSYAFLWEVSRPLSDFANVGVDLYVDTNSGRIYSRMSDPNFWFVSEEVASTFTGVLTQVFKKAMYKEEALKLDAVVSGAKENLIATFTDKAEVSDLLETSFQLELVKNRLIDKKLFKGVVPTAQIEKSRNQFVIQLGKLPGVDTDDLKKGVELKIKITANRTLSSAFSAQQPFSIKYKVP